MSLLIELVQDRKGQAFLDTSGQEFKAGLQSHPFAVKPNSDEAAALLQIPLKDDADYCLAVQRLRDAGVEVVALSRGSYGIILSAGKELVIATPPSVSVRSPVGVGDAALAGLLWAVMDGCPPAQTAARAVACGTPTAMQEGTAVGDRALVEDILDRVKVELLVKAVQSKENQDKHPL